MARSCANACAENPWSYPSSPCGDGVIDEGEECTTAIRWTTMRVRTAAPELPCVETAGWTVQRLVMMAIRSAEMVAARIVKLKHAGTERSIPESFATTLVLTLASVPLRVETVYLMPVAVKPAITGTMLMATDVTPTVKRAGFGLQRRSSHGSRRL